MKPCEKCGQIKDWNGDSPKCPFKTQNTFADNWNCGHINKIRDLCDTAMNGEDYRLHYQYCDDQKYVTINTSDIDYNKDEDAGLGLCLWVTWYKSRGRTEQMWILGEYGKPKNPTFEQLQLIIEYYIKEGVLNGV